MRRKLREQNRGRSAEHSHLDVLRLRIATARDQRGEDCLANNLPTIEIQHAVIAYALAAFGVAIECGEPGEGLDMRIGARQSRHFPFATEAARRHEHDARITRSHLLEAIAHPIDCAGAEILNHHVGGLGQPPRELAVGFVLEIELDRAAIGIEAGISRGRTAPGRERVHDEFVRRLDLDHGGAELSELRRRPRRHSAETEIDHADAGNGRLAALMMRLARVRPVPPWCARQPRRPVQADVRQAPRR